MSNTTAMGVYGKVASQPDFLRVNAGEFSQAGLDLWFQEGVESLRGGGTALPEGPTGFVLRGPVSGEIFSGAFAPSADAAGRTFPLVIFRKLVSGNLAETFPALTTEEEPFVRAAGHVAAAAAAGALHAQDLTAAVTTRMETASEGTGPKRVNATWAQESSASLFSALGGLPDAVGYALRTFTMACDQAAKMTNAGKAAGPATPGAAITVDAPAPTPSVRQLWLEIARRRVPWRELFPSFLWTDGPAGRLLVTLGQPTASSFSYLANPHHRGSRFWPLRTELAPAREQAMKALTAEQRRVLEHVEGSLGALVSAFGP